MGLPPIEHVIYIPSMMLVGFVAGYIFGGRAARDAEAAQRRADERKAERRAAREAARKAAADKSDPSP